MPLSKTAVGLALVAVGAAACLGDALAQRGLLKSGWAAPATGEAWALARYEGWLSVLFAQCIAWLAVVGITRLGSSKAIGPNVQLAIFHDANALVGVALAIALHGSGAAWPLAFLCAGKLLVAAAQALRLPRTVAATAVGLFCGAALGLAHLFEGASLTYWTEHLLGAGSPWVKTAAVLDRFQGVAPFVFGVGVTFRYTLMRYFSWAVDSLFGSIASATHPGAVERAYSDEGGAAAAVASPRIGAVGGLSAPGAAGAFDGLAARMAQPESPSKVHTVSTATLQSSSWPAFLSYALFPPTYLAGPIVTAAEFYQQAAATCAGRNTTRSLAGGAWWRAAARLAGCALFAEVLRRTFFTDSTVHTLLAAQPWHAFALGYALLTALFAQNFVPWTFARLAAGGLGIATVDEAPVGYLRSSVTPRTFWRNYHVSWYRWLCRYVYVPCGGGASALVATLAVSTVLHGANRAWLVWGAIQCAALLIERSLRGRRVPGFAWLHPHLRTALVQCATQTTLLVQLPLGPSLPRFLLCFHAINLPFCVLNAARVAAKRAPSLASPQRGSEKQLLKSLSKGRPAAKLAWE